ncbi:actin-binding protein IPP-like [Amphiura filiformis]|uniref:actin-binding protein IPP-like n=1 Tax=Amphiura filiformis TaxID=82378 RepID=UPI003B228B94
MAQKASGQEFIEHKTNIIANIGEHFNNADISDVTLTVGEQVFPAHRFVLATQSKVFLTMLMGENWKESEEKKITLQESPEGEASFSDFLKFLYTGTLTLTIDNVCGIHTLADKYDVPALKDDCVGFMKDVLTGIHGDALKAALEWLQYVESFLPDLVAICYSAFRTNFAGIVYIKEYTNIFLKLTYDQVRNILSVPEIQEELVLIDEVGFISLLCNIYTAEHWRNMLLPLVRLYNIDIDRLQSYKTKLKNISEKYYSEAYLIHAERNNIASKACKRRRFSQGFVAVACGCDMSSSQVCPHMNPRFYLYPPFGMYTRYQNDRQYVMDVEPIDLTDLAGFSQKLLYPGDENDDKLWTINMRRNYTSEPICENYIVSPAASHVGRKFTIAIACCVKTPDKVFTKFEYAIKYTGVVINEVMVQSPRRLAASWQMSDDHIIGVSIILHK